MSELKTEVQKKIQDKIDADSKEVSEEESQLSIVNTLKGLESLVYSNKTLKIIMLFIEYVLYIITAIFCIKGLFVDSVYSISIFTMLTMSVIILLCAIKGKKKSITISLALIAVFRFIGMSRINAFSFLPAGEILKIIIDKLIIIVAAAYVGYRAFLKNKTLKF